jgi:hypothetical protein
LWYGTIAHGWVVTRFDRHPARGEIGDCADDRLRNVRIGDIDEMQSYQSVAGLIG